MFGRLTKKMAKRHGYPRRKPNPPTESERTAVYTALTNNGPDVDARGTAFGRLVSAARKAGVIDDYDRLCDWLKDNGWFGPKSDRLRSEGDKFYP